MTAPRLEIDLEKIHHNALTLVTRLRQCGISVTGVTKATLASPEIAKCWLQAGVTELGDSRIENIAALQQAEVAAPMMLIRTPMLSQAEQVVTYADVSCQTELSVIRELSSAAQKLNRSHGVLLMVELGDLREGIMPAQLETTVREVLSCPHIKFQGIGTNLACRSGVSPDRHNMAELSALADTIDATFDITMSTVSGGTSANLNWALNGADTGRINQLRLGEALLLGREPLQRQPIPDLHTDAITLIAEVIESKTKPAQPWGEIAQSAFGTVPARTPCDRDQDQDQDQEKIQQSIFAIGRQDIDPAGLEAPDGIQILAASSDHLVVDSGQNGPPLVVGSETRFQLNYSALLRAMTSPYVAKFTH